VRREGGATSWLYGTLHDAGPDAIPRTVWDALATSHQFVSELGDDEPDPSKLAELARLPFGRVLDQMLPPDDWYDLVDALRGSLKEDDLRHARPWFAMMRLTAKLAPAAKPSMDVALAERARALHLPVEHLETWEDQLAAVDTTVTPADLSQAIHARATMACELARMLAAYSTGDATTMTSLLRMRATDQLVAGRNRKWQPELERALTKGTFVAVGLAHLLGDDGLPAQLAHAGYVVERVR
jgi:uncharacterized protein YbaP (TraB family)